MSKYIDSEKLIAEIERHIKEVKEAENRFHPNLGFFDAKLSGIYDTLSIIDSLQQEQPKRICTRCVYLNKTDDICEYPYGGKSSLINENGVYECNGFEEVEQQEQPSLPDNLDETARHVYESWMGGTMDDVRRDMVELGKALNARKEEK